MFARFSSGAYTCVRCQRRQQCQNARWIWPAQFTSAPLGNRPQSTAIAIAEDHGEHEVHNESHHERPQPQEIPTRRKRKWMPAQTEQLGVPSLGKPAEVLVLPSRDRKIPVVSPGKEDPAHQIQTSLDSESQPVTSEQVYQNLEHIRAKATEQIGPLERDRYNELFRSIHEGFSQKQLAKYALRVQPKEWAKSRYIKSGFPFKKRAAHFILKTAWGIVRKDRQEVQETPEPVETRDVTVPQPQLEVLLLPQRSRALQDLSEEHNVQLDVFREDSKIRLTRSVGPVAPAETALHALRRAIKKSQLSLSPNMEKVLKWQPDKFATFIRDVGRKHEVYIDHGKDASQLLIWHHRDNINQVEEIRRDIILAAADPPRSSKILVLPHRDTNIIPLTAAGHVAVSAGNFKGLSWGRYTVQEKTKQSGYASSEGSKTDDEASSVDGVYKALSGALFPEQVRWPQGVKGIRQDFTAQFGQVLFEYNPSHQVATDSIDITKPPKFKFADIAPSLPQYLASLPTWHKPSKYRSVSSVSSEISILTALKAADQNTSSPSIEILLRGKDSQAGFNQPLTVQNISAVLEFRAAYLLLPNSAVDVQFTNKIKYNMFTAGEMPSHEFGRMFEQLNGFFKSAKSSKENRLSPFVKLRLPQPLFIKKRAKATSRAKDQEYVLESVETIDVASFVPHSESRLNLDHVAFDGGPYGADREVVRLASQPFLGSDLSINANPQSIFDDGIYVARQLGLSKFRRPQDG